MFLVSFFGFSISANFDWFNGFLLNVKWFLLVIIAFIIHLQGFIGIKCVIRQFLASQNLIVDMIFEWLEFLVEVQTEKNRKSTAKKRKIPKNTEKTGGGGPTLKKSIPTLKFPKST